MENPEFEKLAASASSAAALADPGDLEAPSLDVRIQLWRKQEWHGWFRWWLCGRGGQRLDWSKPIWIVLLASGFTALAFYGAQTGKWHVTAGGVVLWFTLVNLTFFTYFGLSLPGPPPVVPGPFAPDANVRATFQIYPPGYNRRKLARLRFRIPSNDKKQKEWLVELAVAQLPAELTALIHAQSTWRIQHGDAPATDAIVETLPVTRDAIDAGAPPLRLRSWRWSV